MTEFSIYQINVDRDTANVCFIGMESLEKIKGTKEVNAAAYDRVYDAKWTASPSKTSIRSSMLTIPPTTKDALFLCRM